MGAGAGGFPGSSTGSFREEHREEGRRKWKQKTHAAYEKCLEGRNEKRGSRSYESHWLFANEMNWSRWAKTCRDKKLVSDLWDSEYTACTILDRRNDPMSGMLIIFKV